MILVRVVLVKNIRNVMGRKGVTMDIFSEWNFGDDKKLSEKLKHLVLSGKKTATTALFKEGQRIPKVGACAAILDSDKKRFCVVEYTAVEVKPFLEVDYDFIQKEGNLKWLR
jgi:uncharacterized protein YhfF